MEFDMNMKMPSWYQNSCVTAGFSRSSPNTNFKISAQKQPSTCHQNFFTMQSSKQKFNKTRDSAQVFNFSTLLHSQAQSSYLLHFPNLHFVSNLLLPEGRVDKA
jgi:hypothetical protein